MRKLLLGILLAGLCLPVVAETYKCVTDGKVRYTNQSPGAKDNCVMVLVRKPPVPSVAGMAKDGTAAHEANKVPAAKTKEDKTLADKILEDRLKKVGMDEAQKKDEEKQAQEAARAQNCISAKMNVETLKLGRVSRVNEKGEKYFLDEATLAKEMTQANMDVEKWCGEAK